ncbi:transposase (fragment) [Mesorhizobium sp. ORS 3324]
MVGPEEVPETLILLNFSWAKIRMHFVSFRIISPLISEIASASAAGVVHDHRPGGGIALDGKRWVSSRPAFLLPVRVLGKLFTGWSLCTMLAGSPSWRNCSSRGTEGIPAPLVASPEEVLGGLRQGALRRPGGGARLSAAPHASGRDPGQPPHPPDESDVTFRYKDYRREGADRQQIMTLATDEFIRRFLLHVLPRGFHRIRSQGQSRACS